MLPEYSRAMGRATATANVVHLLLTRFNVIGNIVHPIADDWLQHRLKLFQSLCLPSVASQTDQDFVWLVFVDESTRPEFLGVLGACQQARFFEICSCRQFNRRYLSQAVQKYVCGYNSVITSRLDNDDIVHPTYIARVKGIATRICSSGVREKSWINLTNGYRISSDGLYYVRDSSNSFISLLEFIDERAELVTVYAVNHTRAESIAPICSVDCAGSWIQVVHGYNLLNRIGKWAVPMRQKEAETYLSDFSPEVTDNCAWILKGRWDLGQPTW
jgi:hypothetical protein